MWKNIAIIALSIYSIGLTVSFLTIVNLFLNKVEDSEKKEDKPKHRIDL